jgi:DNA ligase 1
MYVDPMLLDKDVIPQNSKQYINEPKWDGHRLIYSKIGGITNLYTRHGNLVTNKYPELLDVVSDFDDIVLDGEVIYYDPTSQKDNFDTLISKRFLISNEYKIRYAASKFPVVFMVFDILRLNGMNLYSMPLFQRKILLNDNVKNSDHLQKNQYYEGNGVQLFEWIKERNMEGIVQKDKYSKYYPSIRSTEWKKIIAYKTAECTILGYRTDQFGWLIGQRQGERLDPLGVVEFGPSPSEKKAFYQVSKSLITKTTKNMIYIDPVLKCKVKFRSYTQNNKMRIPVFEEFVY